MNSQFSRLLGPLGELTRGFLLGNLAEPVLQERARVQETLLALLYAELLGLPVPGRYYALGLLPFFCRELPGWKRRRLAEKDLTVVHDLM
ncbi:MAG: hypothetical protein M1299_01640 [Firmicutes bacterium]|nr:hypothetical protein [Bacillota bacterium]MCL5038528.1 hypothetical protein [Bacillota bacterium]